MVGNGETPIFNRMSVKAGERAEQSGRFWCEKCRESVRVDKGEVLPVSSWRQK